MVEYKAYGGRAPRIAFGLMILVFFLADSASSMENSSNGTTQDFSNPTIYSADRALTNYQTPVLSPFGAEMTLTDGLPDIPHENGLRDISHISGMLEANGTHFEIRNSSYLNITLDSSEPINVTLESVPEMVTMRIESISDAVSTQISIEGFAPLTTYHKYEDDYHNHTAFTTDPNGSYTYTQDLSNKHHIFIQPRPSTRFINDNATGGDCTSIGAWNAATKTCTLATKLSETIQIDSNGITLNGNGHTITGSNTGYGVYLLGRSNVTIKNLNLKQFYYGIYLDSSSNNTLSGNNASNSYKGIYLYSSNNNTLSGNNANSNNRYSSYGIHLIYSSNNTLSGNTASSNNGLGIHLYSSSNNTLSGNNATSNNNLGISLSSSSNNTLSGNNASSTYISICLSYSSNNTLSGNNASSNNHYGISLDYSSNNNTLRGNTASSNNGYGIYLSYSSNNTLSSNIASSNNYYDIYLSDSSNNTLSGNNASSNNGYGIYLYSSSNNTIYSNNFEKGQSTYSNNLWNSPLSLTYTYNSTNYINKLGNYWSDYSGTDENGDGIGDNVYTIKDEADYYPLMKPFENYVQTATTTNVRLNETTSTIHTLFEEIIIQNATLNTSVTGDLNGTLNFTDLEIVLINSGYFEGKGFSRGNWSANIESIPYNGYWQGMLFKKPDERKINVKGVVSGGLKGIVEGNLIESINGSGIYDQYQANWTISQIGADIVYAKLELNGKVNYQDEVEYSSELYALQTSIQGTASGYYNGSLGIVLTHVRIDNETKPYYGEGFSIVSYISESGSGEGWMYDRLTSPGIVEMKGFVSEPLNGMIEGVLKNEANIIVGYSAKEIQSARSLTLNIESITVGLPPREDLRVYTTGPKNVSSGQTFNYEHEISNIGPKTAYDLQVVEKLDSNVSFVSASNGYTYYPQTHSVSWDYEKLDPFSKIDISTQVVVLWGVADGTIILDNTTVEQQNNNIFYHGINWESDQDFIDAQDTVKNLDADLVFSYWGTDAQTGAYHVYLGYNGIPTWENSLKNHQWGKKYNIAFSHSHSFINHY